MVSLLTPSSTVAIERHWRTVEEKRKRDEVGSCAIGIGTEAAAKCSVVQALRKKKLREKELARKAEEAKVIAC